MRSKGWLLVALSLPIVGLLGWLLYEQAMIAATPAPRWLASAAGQYYATCEAAAQLSRLQAEPVADPPAASITRGQAQTIASRVLRRQHGFFPLHTHGPFLVRATFPDGERRLAWFQLALIDDGGGSLLGAATITSLDARTGEPLSLVTDLTVGDPFMTCGGPAVNVALSPRQFIAAALLIGYVLMLVAASGVVWLFRQARARRAADLIGHRTG